MNFEDGLNYVLSAYPLLLINMTSITILNHHLILIVKMNDNTVISVKIIL